MSNNIQRSIRVLVFNIILYLGLIFWGYFYLI